MGEMEAVAAYKTPHHAGSLTVVDRWFASSQIHHGCSLPDGTPYQLIGKHPMDEQPVCPITGALVDRDMNAARNLRDWPDTPVEAQLGLRPRTSAVPAVVPETAAQTIASTDGLGSLRKTVPMGRPRAVRLEPESQPRQRNSARRAPE